MIDQNLNNDNISIKEIIENVKNWFVYLIAKWYIILGVGIISGLIGFFYAINKEPIYTASTTFVLEEAGNGGVGSLGGLGGLASMAGIDVGGGGGIFQGDNLFELYKSRKMLQKTLLTKVDIEGKTAFLIDHFIHINNLREKWNDQPELKNIEFDSIKSDSLNRLQTGIIKDIEDILNQSYLSVGKLDKKLNIVLVSTVSKNEAFAKAFNDILVKNVNDFYIETKTKKAQENVDILDHKADSIKREMNGAIYASANVIDATPNLNPTRQVLRAPVQRSQFSAETNKTILTEVVKNLELAKLNLMRETPLIQVIDSPVYPLDVKRLSKMKGIITGFAIGSILAILTLFFLKVFKRIMDVN
jgi:hypothetical protein